MILCKAVIKALLTKAVGQMAAAGQTSHLLVKPAYEKPVTEREGTVSEAKDKVLSVFRVIFFLLTNALRRHDDKNGVVPIWILAIVELNRPFWSERIEVGQKSLKKKQRRGLTHLLSS